MPTKINNIILISIDTLRYDCVGYQPDKRELQKYDVLKYLETPTLDSIAEKSLCFTQCISTNTYTTAAHASLFTGVYPPGHGVRQFYGKKLSKKVFTIAETLKVYGFNTAMHTDTLSHFVPTQLSRGFDHVMTGDDEGFLKLLEKLRGNDSKNFIFAHFFDVHIPYLSSENPKYNNGIFFKTMEELYRRNDIPFDNSRFSESEKYFVWKNLFHQIGSNFDLLMPLYVQGVTMFDKGRFRDFIKELARLGYMEDSLIAIFSDHGEGRADYENADCFGHSGPVFENVIRVPLMLHHKDIQPDITDRVVSLVDIFPTVIDLALNRRVEDILPYSVDGINLHESKADRQVYCEAWLWDSMDRHWNLGMTSYLLFQRALRDKRHKYIIFGMPEAAQKISDYSTDEDFLRDYYRCLLCKFEPYDEFKEKLESLKKNTIKRQDLLESDLIIPYHCYDIEADYLEQRPLYLAKKPPEEMNEILNEIIRLNNREPDSEDIFESQNNYFFKNLAEQLILLESENTLSAVSNNKHLLYELIEKVILDPSLSDESYIRRIKQVFFISETMDEEIEKIISLLESGITRRSYFNEFVFNNRKFVKILEQGNRSKELRCEYLEFHALKQKYEDLTGSLFYKIFSKATFFVDRTLFPEGTRRRSFYLQLIHKLRGRLNE